MSLDISTVQGGRLCTSRVPSVVSASKDDEVGSVESAPPKLEIDLCEIMQWLCLRNYNFSLWIARSFVCRRKWDKQRGHE